MRQAWLHAAAGLLAVATAALGPGFSTSGDCAALKGGEGVALQPCLDSLPPGAVLALPPRQYLLTQPVTLRRPVRLTTAGLGPNAPRCGEDGLGCAILTLPLAGAGPGPPLILGARGIVLDHLVIEGHRGDPATVAPCAGPERPGMGGLSIRASGAVIRDSVLRDMACFSAAVAEPGADGLRFTGNAVLANGTHDRAPLWADGLTVTEAAGDVIRDNDFRDNTDVQLVLGGCQRCTVAGNRFTASDRPGTAAFTALLVHGWPHTSGDYAGTAIIGNSIDCGPGRRCGVGLGVGGRVWYLAATSGGVVAGNDIRRAGIGINVNDATGPMTLADNRVAESGGIVQTHCGPRAVAAVNITQASAAFVDVTAGVAMDPAAVSRVDFAGCLPGLP